MESKRAPTEGSVAQSIVLCLGGSSDIPGSARRITGLFFLSCSSLGAKGLVRDRPTHTTLPLI